jgi:hypothetical protein
VRKKYAIVLLVAALSALSRAQIPSSGNIFFGYSYSQGQVFTRSTVPLLLPAHANASMNGWDAAVEGKFLPWIGAVADFDWHYGGSDLTQNCQAILNCNPGRFRLNGSRHEVLFGPRASVSIGRYTPFAEFLIGFAHQTDTGGKVSNSQNTFATAIGGGIDYRLLKGLAWRAQLDSIHTSFFNSSQNQLRISTGIVFRF